MGKKREKAEGLSAWVTLIPSIIVIGILAALSVLFVYRITKNHNQLIAETEEFRVLTKLSSQMQTGSDRLTDTVRLYVATGNEKKYLKEGYFKEAKQILTRDKAIEGLEEMAANRGVLDHLVEAMRYSTELMQIEFHAMRLRAEADGLDLSEYSEVAAIRLSGAEQALSPEGKIAAAEKMLIDEEYYGYKKNISSNVDDAVRMIMNESTDLYQLLAQRLQYDLWALLFVLIALMIGIVYVSYFVVGTLVAPLLGFRRDIDAEQAMRISGSKELRILARSYNDLLDRRKKLEADLHNTAETDSLTRLPNRLAMNYYITEISETKQNFSIALISLDVNNLKPTNDKMGHSSGDELLRNASDCILEAFGNLSGRNCFRFGGDEFAVFITKVTEAEVIEKISEFKKLQKKYNVSIAVGYAYAENVRTVSIQDLFDRADLNMYVDKAKCKQSGEKNASADSEESEN